MNIFLFGYYGYQNVGDDIMLNNLLSMLLKQRIIQSIYVNARSIDILDRIDNHRIKYITNDKPIWSKLYRLFAALKCSYWIWGGGTCLFGIKNNDGLLNLYKWIKLSKILNKKFIFLGIGIGELDKTGKKITQNIIESAVFISFREKDSIQIAKQLVPNISINNTILSGDLFFLNPAKLKRQSIIQKNELTFHSE